MIIKIYTDGGVSMKNHVGGWAAVLVFPNGERKGIKGGVRSPTVTNNTMELSSVIEGLKYAAVHHAEDEIEIISDSEYVVKGATLWAPGWIMKNWKCTTGPVKNKELWIELLGLVALTNAKLSWVRGHNDDPNNETADKLCVSAYKELLNETT